MKLSVITMLALAVALPAGAFVDLSTGAYEQNFIDLQDKSAGFTFERKYSSVCEYSGTFGKGWTTPYDTTLKLDDLAVLKLSYKGCVREIKYHVTPGSLLALGERGIGMDEVKGVAASDPERLKGLDIVFYSATPWLKGFPLAFHLTEGRYVDEYGTMEFDPATGFALKINESETTFDAAHRLKTIKLPNGESVKFERPEASTMTATLSGPKGGKATYSFGKDGNLSKVVTAWGNTYTHTWDGSGRIQTLTWPDATNIVVLYDKWINRATLYKNRDDCTEQYFIRKIADIYGVSGEVIRRCKPDDKVIAHSYYRVELDDRESGGIKRLDEYTDTGANAFVQKTTFYDSRNYGRSVFDKFSAVKTEREKDFGFLPMKVSPITGGEALVYFHDEETDYDDVDFRYVHTMTKGGDSDDLKGRSGFGPYLEGAKSRFRDKKDFMKVSDTFFVADYVDAIEHAKGDGIIIEGGELNWFRKDGEEYGLLHYADGHYEVNGVTDSEEDLTTSALADPARKTESAKAKEALGWAQARLDVYLAIEDMRRKR